MSDKAIYYRLKAVRNGKGDWVADENGLWQYVRVNEGRGKRPEWLAFAEKQAASGGRGFQFRLRNGAWSEPIYRTIAAAREAANADSGKVSAKAPFSAEGIVGGLLIATDKFLAEIKANKSHKTYLAYANSLSMFRDSCRKSEVADVNRSDIMAFKLHLMERKSEDGSKLSPRSLFNNFLNVSVFFKWAGCPFIGMGIRKGDWFPKPEREPEAYTEDEMKALFTAANEEERLILKSFLNSGFRTGELAHLTYGDIDFQNSIWAVRPKVNVGNGQTEWKPKTTESQREVAIHPDITKRILSRKKARAASDTDLVFPNTEGNPDQHLIRIVKRVAKRAKVTGRVDDHKFRSTAITLWLQAGHTVPDVMKWVGHVDPKTILRYAAKINLRRAETRAKITKTFDSFASMGD